MTELAARSKVASCLNGGRLSQARKPRLVLLRKILDPITGKHVGWMPVNCTDKQDKYHCEAFSGQSDGTYELIGPKVQGNPEGLDRHTLIAHGKAEVFEDCPRDMDDLENWLTDRDIEGIVFHHPDGRMAKIKKRDFNLKR